MVIQRRLEIVVMPVGSGLNELGELALVPLAVWTVVIGGKV